MDTTLEKEYRRLSTPRTAAIAGILFGVLFAASLLLMRSAIPQGVSTNLDWVTNGERRINLALAMMPFAGIAYLWFIGVVRDKLGEYEDRFFSTVFFGSSLLFLALVFLSMAVAGSIVSTYRLITGETPDYTVILFGRALMVQISNVYALRMAGVTMISLGTIWIRTGLVPRWLSALTFTMAALLLVVTNYNLWVTLVYPAWVTTISVYILYVRLTHPEVRVLTPEQ